MAVSDIKARPPSALAEFWFYFSRNKGAVIGLVIFVALVIVAILAPLITSHTPDDQNRAMLLLPPVWQEGGSSD